MEGEEGSDFLTIFYLLFLLICAIIIPAERAICSQKY